MLGIRTSSFLSDKSVKSFDIWYWCIFKDNDVSLEYKLFVFYVFVHLRHLQVALVCALHSKHRLRQ